MEQSLLNGFQNAVENEKLGVYGIHVYQEGKRSVELFLRENERVHLYSGSKAFTSMAVGIAAGEGRLNLDDKALDFFPELRSGAAPGNEQIRVRDLLQMRAGHNDSLFHVETPPRERDADWAGLFFATPMERAAGEVFLYDNGCSYMLSRIVGAVSGQTLRDYLIPRLFDPLDIFNPQWHTCPDGHSLGAIGLYLNTEEFSRLGRLMLQDGCWQDRQLVPAEYLRAAEEDTVETGDFGDEENRRGYGYQLWRCTVTGAYRADGKYGQYSIVFPELEAVVTVTAHNERCANDILRAVWREILPRLRR